MTLTEYLRQVFRDRSFRGLRSVRPRPRETVVLALWALVILYAVAALVSTGVGTRCLIDWNANSCNGWINH
jgi:hypothetical protein